jgi:hypothetical protein
MGLLQAVSAGPGKPVVESLHASPRKYLSGPRSGSWEEKMRPTTVLWAAVGGLTAFSPFTCKDKEVRQYIESDLRPYLDSITREVCATRQRDNQSDNWLCVDPELAHPHVPPNGKP